MSFVSELERELVRVGQQRVRSQRAVRFDAGPIVVALAAASSLAVALVALAFVGHAPPRAGSGPSAIPPAAARLAAKLSVLRRPQTPADRALPNAVARAAAGGGYLPGLTRAAATLPGVRAFLVVSPPDPANVELTQQWPLSLGARVTLVVLAPGETDTAQPTPAAGLGAMDTLSGRRFVAMIVPDGVARVQFTLLARGTRRPRHPRGAPTRVVVRTVTVNAPVFNNVALAPSHGGLLATKVRWYAADGRGLPTPSGIPEGWPAIGLTPSDAKPSPPALAARLRATFPTFAAGPWSDGILTVSRPSLDAVPGWLASMASPSPGPPGIVTPSFYVRSTLQLLTTTGLEAWVVPSSDGFCVYGAQGGGCTAVRGGALVSGAWGVIGAPDGTPYEVGVLPKTNSSVIVVKNSGARWRIPVHDGVVAFVAIGVMRVEYTGADGRPSLWH